jgi:hypothetical protein
LLLSKTGANCYYGAGGVYKKMQCQDDCKHNKTLFDCRKEDCIFKFCDKKHIHCDNMFVIVFMNNMHGYN